MQAASSSDGRTWVGTCIGVSDQPIRPKVAATVRPTTSSGAKAATSRLNMINSSTAIETRASPRKRGMSRAITSPSTCIRIGVPAE